MRAFWCFLALAAGGCGRLGYDAVRRDGGGDAGGARPGDGPPGVDARGLDAAPFDGRPPAADGMPRDAPGEALDVGAPTDAPPPPGRDALAAADGAAPTDGPALPAADGPAPARDAPLAADAVRDAPLPADGAGDAPLAGACGVAHPAALACWDFDDPAVLPPPPAATGAGVRDTSRSAAGPASLRVTTAARRHGGYAVDTTWATPVTSGALYVRSHFFVPRSAAVNDFVVLMEAIGAKGKISFDLYGEAWIGLNANGQAQTVAALPRDRWFCAELRIDLHPTAGTARLSLDGALWLTAQGLDTQLGGIARSRAGVVPSRNEEALEIGVDEFVVDTRPIGCP